MHYPRRRRRRGGELLHGMARVSLAEIPPGCEATLLGFAEVDAGMGGALRSYGLLPGRRVLVLAQQPVTIVQVEQTELALESQLARAILVRVCPREAGDGAGQGDQDDGRIVPSRWWRRIGRRRP